ncbi:Inner membrane ABC transporter permease protein YcjP [Paenibacillus konkukensis]|uniref:Inner membrane ABC transporter permease protein YcjP n=1 Tax=Paenibacillus konkukensis TaxID=2020716 RepID=A0ABY4RIS3_9BACL|nr:carbohydrate ABC transporter permease [Paenibacillus konkukensis]UQZ82043.1 Inner membrane ABC transporter permease protein YcjP [Paenibacillus konkukensis]
MKTYTLRKASFFDALVYAVLTVVLLGVLLPCLYVLLSSFSTKQEMLSRGFFLIPETWTLNAYGYLFNNHNFLTSFKNAFEITIVGTALSISTTTLMAYGLSRTWLKGRKTLNIMVVFTVLFSGGIIPMYLLTSQLGLLNTYWSLFLNNLILPFNLIVMRSFFQNTPKELEEAARMDGCGEWMLFFRVMLPLSMTSVATFIVFYAVFYWNSYFQAILFISDSQLIPLQVFLRQIVLESGNSLESISNGYEFGPPVKMAVVVMASLPMIVMYPFFQKYFDKGMLVGSVKG